MGGRQHGENRMGERNRQAWTMTPLCGPLKVFPDDPVRTAAPSRSGSWYWWPASTIKEDRASPFSDHLMHGLNRKWEEGHESSQRDHMWSNQRGYLTEEMQVHFEFNW